MKDESGFPGNGGTPPAGCGDVLGLQADDVGGEDVGGTANRCAFKCIAACGFIAAAAAAACGFIPPTPYQSKLFYVCFASVTA